MRFVIEQAFLGVDGSRDPGINRPRIDPDHRFDAVEGPSDICPFPHRNKAGRTIEELLPADAKGNGVTGFL